MGSATGLLASTFHFGGWNHRLPTLLGNADFLASSPFSNTIPVRLLALTLLLPLRRSVTWTLVTLLQQPFFVGLAGSLVALPASRNAAARTAVSMPTKAAPAHHEPRAAFPPPALDEDQLQPSRTVNPRDGHRCTCDRCSWREALCPPITRTRSRGLGAAYAGPFPHLGKSTDNPAPSDIRVGRKRQNMSPIIRA